MVSAWWLLVAVVGGAWIGMLLFAVMAIGGRNEDPPGGRSPGALRDGTWETGGTV